MTLNEKGTLRGTDFYILVFLQPYLGLVEVKTGTLTSDAYFPQTRNDPNLKTFVSLGLSEGMGSVYSST